MHRNMISHLPLKFLNQYLQTHYLLFSVLNEHGSYKKQEVSSKSKGCDSQNRSILWCRTTLSSSWFLQNNEVWYSKTKLYLYFGTYRCSYLFHRKCCRISRWGSSLPQSYRLASIFGKMIIGIYSNVIFTSLYSHTIQKQFWIFLLQIVLYFLFYHYNLFVFK